MVYLKKVLILLLAMLFLVGCRNKSLEEAEQLVIKENTSEIGTVKIIKSTEKNGKFQIEWRNEENREGGLSEVSKRGKIKVITAYIE